MQLTRGQRALLSDPIASTSLRVEVDLQGVAVDVSCFGLDAKGQLSDDRYLVFFNQTKTPCGGVSSANPAGSTARFDLVLDRLPRSIERLVFVAAIDGPGTMRQLASGRVFLIEGERQATFAFKGGDFDLERALMLIEIYRKDGVWRVAATGQGFNGGMDALVRHFGGEVADAPVPVPPPARLSLEKRLEKEAPHLVSLAKTKPKCAARLRAPRQRWRGSQEQGNQGTDGRGRPLPDLLAVHGAWRAQLRDSRKA